jgi:DNA-binding transcriptional LysR family regulator
MFDLDQLRIVEAIARQGSFTAAAQVLHRVPSTISYAVGKLEEDLGVRLFLREGRSVCLTAEGEELLRQGRYLLQIAEDAQRAVRQVSTGWEPELRIALSDLLSWDAVLSLIEEFQQVAPDTRVRLTTEVLAGAWDALHTGRADLVIGAAGEMPFSSGIVRREMGEVKFVFAVSPDHPLARVQEPLSADQIRPYPVIAVADTSRDLPVRTSDILPGQSIITVPDMHYKLQAHRRGIGVGSLPEHMIREDLRNGKLVIRETTEGAHKVMLLFAWRSRQPGLGLEWFVDRLTGSDPIDWFG